MADADRAADLAATPQYYGGQAVLEGVMMRGADVWAVAVRRPDGDIYLERRATSDLPTRHRSLRLPLVRGVVALGDALSIGTRALAISARESAGEEETPSSGELGGSLVLALLLFVGVFVLLPNAGLGLFRGVLGDGWRYHLVEGVLRIAIFLGYLAAIARVPEIRRVFRYHGAEHKTIAAREHDEPLETARIQRYSTKHVRCGTNFLILVMLVALLVYSLAGALVPAPDGGFLTAVGYHVALRIALLPVVAGLAYEGLRLGAAVHNPLVRFLMQPGLWLQRITTGPPDDDMVEVAVCAFAAVVPPAVLGRRGAAVASRVVWGRDERVPGGGDPDASTDAREAGPR